MTKTVALLILLLPSAALAQQRQYYDASGRNAGRDLIDSRGSSTFYDPSGRVSGRSSTSGGTTIYYDGAGRRVGSTSITPRR
jgi:YD repeat-containing protein